MEPVISTVPGYRVFEYLLMIGPREELGNRILKVKEDFAGTYKTRAPGKGRPFITLVMFSQRAMLEERIIGRLRNVAMGFPPFKVELKDYGSFPSHTIYINVTSKLPVQGLVREIRSSSQRLMKLNEDNKPHFIMEPHLTIARKLKPWQYEKGWLEYSHRHFTGRFIAEGMTLLKRPAGEPEGLGPRYRLVADFEFQNLPVTTRQGELFSHGPEQEGQ